jgi:hypothetical protein
LSRTAAAATLIAVVVIAGGVGYAILNATGLSSSGSAPPVCGPPPRGLDCAPPMLLNDVVLFPAFQPGFGQSMLSLGAGVSLPANVSLWNGETASNFTVSWGDGSNTTQKSSTFTHPYHDRGTYVISATAQVGGITHTGTNYLFPVTVVPPTLADPSSDLPTLATTFSNGSATGPNYPWIHAGGRVSVSAYYSALPSAAGYTAGSPNITSSGGAEVSDTNTTTSATATYSFSVPGQYSLTMVGSVSGPGGTVYQNYTWGVYVGAAGTPLGCTYCKAGGALGPASPHLGSLYVYEIVPGGATSLDPAVDYENTGAEVLQNVYETLVQYAGDSTTSFVPVLSTCVPGPAASGPTSCQAQYGTDLVNGTHWTFPVDPNARFYDPGTGASWGVYPSDVMFSVARTLMWLEAPSQYVTNGWIIGQSLLPYGQNSFDGGIHAPWNNTPQYVYTSMLVNDTRYCPAVALASGHGCITFGVGGSGTMWPEFLEFVADTEGASVVPCGWFTWLGAGLPGFTTSATKGDGPCLLPGGVTNTSASAFQSFVASARATLFDPIIALDDTNVYQPQPQVRWNMVGSGPYYLFGLDQGQGYVLMSNPAYSQPNCAGQPGCYPTIGDYARNVYVFWDPNSTTGVEKYVEGQSDISTFYPTDLPAIQDLARDGKVGLYPLPTLNVFFEGFSLHFDPTFAQECSGLTTNIPGDFFASVGMREFLAQSFPYQTFIANYSSLDGIPFAEGVGGAIPDHLGDYYPTNISWPGLDLATGAWHDPNTNPSNTGSAAWWWAQIINPTSVWYDPEAAACTHTTCTFPMWSQLGDSQFDSAVDSWSQIVRTITSGAIQIQRADPTFGAPPFCFGEGSPGETAFTASLDGWLPDYPDPTDYLPAFYGPDGSYTYGPALNETLVQGEWGNLYNGCPGNSVPGFANLAYWANSQPLIPQACQGTAYSVMTWAMNQAAVMPVGSERVLYYDLIEHIANGLVLYVYAEQQLGLGSFASWINPTTIDTNPVGPGQLWFFWNGAGVVN